MQLVAGHRRGALARRVEADLDPVRASAVLAPQMRFARSVNVNSLALDMPTLMGKLA
ncbi:hypothetical protein GPL21_24765 [Bradyrhizobium pachyrhizi]|uniref:Uncharacterized protein n=1 Tax=Bradyrhizobium pachyrhizi TaxID=280333 RepID=A0A844SWQ6_9BRAD|nr:hypothetical protein [Bradyrhizobium pachyrhizi]MVT68314.1 hypothetical protein [Bradyrhizobium pachyrhizi]WFU59693.1 hypothetical protein QA639_20130 [Bradyrhizobium pachyrhizi]